MGADQSTGRNSGVQPGSNPTAKTCYYELLGLEQQATDEEIRRAYKKKALELHPDRNLNDVETATKKFAEVQTAYEILSDPQERAWYDSHRDAILRGVDPDLPSSDHASSSPTQYTAAAKVFDLMSRFRSTVPMTDGPGGYFGVLNLFFDQLAMEEAEACERQGLEPVVYPPFGLARDSYEQVARPFYQAWAGFSTKKSFSWRDKYRLSDAPDRRVRRLMEKENKKFRDEGTREFNDAVLSLVAFVKKRDPRYIPNTHSEVERQQILRNSAAAQAARSRAANQEKLADFVVPEWARSRGDEDHDGEFSLSEDDSEVEHIECVVCNKIFKSEKQFETHEKSKKHKKAVQQLQRQMKKENIALGKLQNLNSLPSTERAVTEQGARKDGHNSDLPISVDRLGIDTSDAGNRQAQAASHSQPLPESSNGYHIETSEDGDYAPRLEIEERLAYSPGPYESDKEMAGTPPKVSLAQIHDPLAFEKQSSQKVGKAKQKRQKKAACQETDTQVLQTCAVCNEAFASRSKLFAHIKEFGHAAPGPQRTGGGHKKGRK